MDRCGKTKRNPTACKEATKGPEQEGTNHILQQHISAAVLTVPGDRKITGLGSSLINIFHGVVNVLQRCGLGCVAWTLQDSSLKRGGNYLQALFGKKIPVNIARWMYPCSQGNGFTSYCAGHNKCSCSYFCRGDACDLAITSQHALWRPPKVLSCANARVW